MARYKKWTREELTQVFELLIEGAVPVVTHNEFRKHLSRDENLFTNQVIRSANGNIAYRAADCDVFSLSDEEFWEYIDGTRYSELIEENAAMAILKMAEKFQLTN